MAKSFRLVSGLLLALASVLAVAGPAAAEITGKRPTVLDGNRILLAGYPIRFYGIAAPAIDQTCEAQGAVWNCGAEARWAVADRIGLNWVACEARGRDPDGAIAATCYLGGIGGPELNAWLVANGWALAYRQESEAYVVQEKAAERARRGLWRGRFVRPWLWSGQRQ